MTDVQFTRYQQFYERAFSVFGDHLGAFVTDMIERDHATSTVKLYLSCINDRLGTFPTELVERVRLSLTFLVRLGPGRWPPLQQFDRI